jgi:hypothetical protein
MMIPCGLEYVQIINVILQYQHLEQDIVQFVGWVLWIGYGQRKERNISSLCASLDEGCVLVTTAANFDR